MALLEARLLIIIAECVDLDNVIKNIIPDP